MRRASSQCSTTPHRPIAIDFRVLMSLLPSSFAAGLCSFQPQHYRTQCCKICFLPLTHHDPTRRQHEIDTRRNDTERQEKVARALGPRMQLVSASSSPPGAPGVMRQARMLEDQSSCQHTSSSEVNHPHGASLTDMGEIESGDTSTQASNSSVGSNGSSSTEFLRRLPPH